MGKMSEPIDFSNLSDLTPDEIEHFIKNSPDVIHEEVEITAYFTERDANEAAGEKELREDMDRFPPTEENWSPDDEGSYKGECDSCGQVKIVQTLGDPFLADVYNEHEERTYCRSCYRNRADDV
jgi:hypothetical protein